jgi:hypothetical protein
MERLEREGVNTEVPPEVALLNYISCGILSRIFSKLKFSRGFLYIYIYSTAKLRWAGAWNRFLGSLKGLNTALVAMRYKITNVPLILKIWEIICCFWANYFMGHFSGYFEGASTFLTPKLSPLVALGTI